MKTVYGNEPLDLGLNCAVRTLANKACPNGWDQVPTFAEAPTTLAGIIAYGKEHGKLCIAEEDSSGTIYADEETNWHLRAWHDSIHFRHLIAFNAAGEAAATYCQVAQLYRQYRTHSREKLVRWGSLILADILGLVHYHQRTGLWPKHKRAGTIKNAPGWLTQAELIYDTCQGPDHEKLAINLARDKWGYPYDIAVCMQEAQ